MNIEFQHPWFLLLFIPVIFFTVFPFARKAKKRNLSNKFIVSLVCRALALTLAVGVLSGFTAVRKTDRNSVIVVADLSDSTRNVSEKFADYVKKAQKFADKKTDVGLLTFGYDSFYEIPLKNKISFTGFETAPSGNYTDIYSALIKAAAMMPAETNKRIIVLTDGKENIKRVREAAPILIRKNIRVDAIIEETGNALSEIQLTDLKTPEVVYNGEDFSITVTVESSLECNADLSLFSDMSLAAKQQVRLTKGTNRFVFKDTAKTAGIVSYSAEITAEGDSLKKNNTVYNFINILGTPKVLIVDGTGTESHELVKLIGDTVQTVVVPPSGVPDNISELRRYNAVVLMNTPKYNLPENWDSLLEVYVRQLGRGVLTTGGDSSYAVGGWAESDLEKILPVDMTAKDEQSIAHMSLMILIDNSGSMGMGPGSPLELAKQGAINSIGILRPVDEVGVIAFSDNAVWISKPTSAQNKKEVQGKVASIREGGGTMLYAAMQEAYKALSESTKSSKHIILLTDGQPADGDKVEAASFLKKLSDGKITVTSIAVGEYAETTLLKKVSDATGGTVTTVKEVDKLPEIIFEQTRQALNKGYVINKTFTPQAKEYTSMFTEVSSLPELDGYVLTSMKDLASQHITDDEGKTILASWQYGLGKTASFMSDLNGKWSSKMLASKNGRQLIENMIAWILPSDDSSESGSVSIVREGDKGRIVATSPDSENSYDTQAVIISPSGKELTISLVQTGIGQYSGEFYLEEEGSYVASVTQKDSAGEIVMGKEGALAVKYSDEYDVFLKNTGSVEAVCKETGGLADWTNIEDILRIKTEGVRESLQFTVPFLIAALVLLLADIAIRRLDISFAGIKKALAKAKEKREEKKKAKLAAASAKDAAVPDISEKNKKQNAAAEEKETKAQNPALAASKEASKDSRKKGSGIAGEQKKTAPTQNKNSVQSSSVRSLLKEKENMKRRKL